MLLESLDHLRRCGHLGPLWTAFEQRIGAAFLASKINTKGWAWQIGDDPIALFDAWKFNLKSPESLEAKKLMLPQLEMAEETLEKIVSALEPPSEAMLLEMDTEIAAIKKEVLALLEDLM